MGSRSVGGQLVVQVMEGYGRIGLHLAAENAREAVGEVDAVFHYVGVGGFATAGRTEQQHTRKAFAIRADRAAVAGFHHGKHLAVIPLRGLQNATESLCLQILIGPFEHLVTGAVAAPEEENIGAGTSLDYLRSTIRDRP